MENKLNKLLSQEKKNVNLENQIEQSFFEGKSFPLIYKPTISDFNLNNWLVNNKDKFEKNLHQYGSILFRGFNINTVEKFHALMNVFPNKLLDYKLRSSPRFEIENNIYISTTYPEDLSINMHSESSYAPQHPERIVFCCITPAEKGGETPIADNRIIMANLSNRLKNKFFEKGILYRRNLSGLLGLSWEEVFQTDDKKIVEEECKNNNMNFKWLDDNGLEISWFKKAIWEHPVTKEVTWFNHGLFFNKHMLDKDILASLKSDEQLPNNTYFGDGSEISLDEIKEIKLAYEKATIEYSWERGDVLFLDNLLFSHGRNPYKGERKIIVSIS